MQSFIDRPVFVLILGLVAALFGVSIFYAARRAVWEVVDPNTTFLAALPAMIIGAVVCLIGLAVLTKPALFTTFSHGQTYPLAQRLPKGRLFQNLFPGPSRLRRRGAPGCRLPAL